LMYEVAVVGAGPAGSATSLAASREGVKTLLLEEHSLVGRPVHCAGIIHPPSFERSGLKVPSDLVQTWIKRVCIYTGLNEPLTDPFKLNLLVVDRERFDQWMAGLAVDSGAKLELSSRVVGVERRGDAWRLLINTPKGVRVEECRVLVAADGVGGSTARLAGIKHRFELASCLQYELEGVKVEDPERIDLYFSSSVAPGGYAWVIPLEEGRRVRVGLGVRGADRPAKYYLDLLVKHLFRDARPTKFFGGCVPVGGPVKPSYGNAILLVGDAASQVNPLTGAGIVGATRCGLIAGKVIAEKLSYPRAEELRVYEKLCDEAVGKGYRRILKARRDLEKLSSGKVRALISGRGLIEDLRHRRYLKAFVKVALHRPSLMLTAIRVFRIRDSILT